MLLNGLLFIVALAGIEALARGRGAYPGIWGVAGVLAFAAGFMTGRVVGGRDSLEQFLFPWILVGVVAFILRFVVGARELQPDGMWSCPNCHMVNEASYIVCQACQEPWPRS